MPFCNFFNKNNVTHKEWMNVTYLIQRGVNTSFGVAVAVAVAVTRL